MGVDVLGTIEGLDALMKRMDEATRGVVEDAAGILKRGARSFAPVGIEGNATDPPGTLVASILATEPEGADGIYHAEVGPWVVYGAQREFGGPIVAHNPSGLLTFTKFGVVYRKPRVFQVEEPYLRPAIVAGIMPIEAAARERVAIAVLGG